MKPQVAGATQAQRTCRADDEGPLGRHARERGYGLSRFRFLTALPRLM